MQDDALKLQGFKIYENPLYEPFNDSSPKASLFKEDNSPNYFPLQDELLENDVDYSLNMFLPHESTLVKDHDIMVKVGDLSHNSFNNTSSSIHFNNLSPIDETTMRYDYHFLRFVMKIL